MCYWFFFKQIHAYNLETNSWEEITTKPHDKIGQYPAAHYQLNLCYFPCKSF